MSLPKRTEPVKAPEEDLSVSKPTTYYEPMNTPKSLMHNLLTFRASDAKKMWRENIFIRDGNRCTYCGSPDNLTIDHVVPRSRGGARWDDTNCTTACRPCNQLKGSMSLEDFHLMIA